MEWILEFLKFLPSFLLIDYMQNLESDSCYFYFDENKLDICAKFWFLQVA